MAGVCFETGEQLQPTFTIKVSGSVQEESSSCAKVSVILVLNIIRVYVASYYLPKNHFHFGHELRAFGSLFSAFVAVEAFQFIKH